jgi:endonuclease/exonuclease/phosphatase family metal-dependent hydrolase
MGLLKVVGWNCKVGRGDDAVAESLRALIADTHPDVICLQEAMHYVDMLRNRFDDDWHVYAHGGWPESTNCPMLVSRDHSKKSYDGGWDTLRTHTPWTGPQGGHHDGRTWTWVKVEGKVVASLHRCWGGTGRNSESFQEEHDKIAAFIDGRDEPVLFLGDHNVGPRDDAAGSSKRIAHKVDGSVRFDEDEPGIDYALCKRIKGKVKRTKTYGSDHKAVVFTETD